MQWEKAVHSCHILVFSSQPVQRADSRVYVCAEELSSSSTLEPRRGRGRWPGCLPGPWLQGPTAFTSQILGNNECFEPYTSNIYSRRVLRSGNMLLGVVTFWSTCPCIDVSVFLLVGSLLWLTSIFCMIWLKWEFGLLKNQIIYEDGSVQKMAAIPDDLKAIYKFVVQPCMLIVYQMQLLFKHLNISMQLLHQNCLGDQAENFGWYGSWPWMLHWSEPEPQCAYGATQLWEANITALPCLVQGI